MISALPKGSISWKNLNPTAVIDEVNGFLDLRSIKNFFHRAGIGQAYLDRPCINPLDPECPESAPNSFKRCQAFKQFDQWNKAQAVEDQVVLEEEKAVVKAATQGLDIINEILGLAKGRKKREGSSTTQAPPSTTKAHDDDYYNYSDDSEYTAEKGKSSKFHKSNPLLSILIRLTSRDHSTILSI